ncbi:rRNA methyltransferase [Neobacillus sp. PS3-40]|uniref:rRNA methyltransferase n=1 Tax=Neobacillus sp. PS3-40 TaxID=3070679 RepID=UPI0027E075EE|nr:rRNA methyltransferase [Neobacillus sp. PS3-40]WML44502.1 rRNA methyltransferase [Neobacillus sp. PS3-40]
MWKSVNNKLVNVTDESRVKFRTNISKSILLELNQLAENHNTYPNYLMETGLRKVLDDGTIQFKKENRPKDRVQYKTTYDKDLLEKVKQFAKDHKLFINDVIEYSIRFIDLNNVKDQNYRNRID